MSHKREWAKGKVGNGTKVHHLWRIDDGKWYSRCGVTHGSSGRLCVQIIHSDTDVTCELCLALVEEHGMGRGVLTAPEFEVVRRLAMGGYEAIAEDLDIAVNTVKNQVHRSSRKLGVYHNGTELLLEALRRGELELEDLIAPPHVLNEEDGPRTDGPRTGKEDTCTSS